eukprot:CAMPEP_0181110536 /NCGR_PEP_ID=MMETSP1071-20121207/18770_1 /TAXON_ID=35127 /ORGANISM="Thalassiosira sp., Strain NH16" /LENGTH=173 /DNA_ID=CAMNT_0023194321 /DNA_START=70 /DNA_END=591 /DNA_ORIENTATION=+
MKSPSLPVAVCLLASITLTNGFVTNNPRLPFPSSRTSLFEQEEEASTSPGEQARPDFEFSFEIPKKGIADIGTAEVSLPPILDSSEIVVVRYDLPFGLSAEPQNGQVIVTKDGKEGGEKVGDVLRQTTYWRGKNPGLFDVSKNADNFDLVVQALVTNDLAVADEIVLVFERPC